MKSQKQDSFTRGSQVFAHQVRMFVQGCINAFIVGLVLTLFWVIIRLCHKITYIGLYYFFIERYIQIKLLIGQFFYHTSQIGIKFYYLKKQKWVYCSAEKFISKFWLNTPYSKQVEQLSKFIVDIVFYEVPIVFVLGTIASVIFFIIKGRKQVATNFMRGGKLVEPKVLAKMLHKAKAASLIKIAGLPLVKNSEGQHILLIGTTGAGKTNTLNILLPQLRSQGHRAIVIDMTGSFYNRFFDPKHDKLLNPFVVLTYFLLKLRINIAIILNF